MAAGVLLVTALVVGTSAVLLHLDDLGTLALGVAGLDALTGGWASRWGPRRSPPAGSAVGDVSTVVVTSTLAGMFAEAAWTGGDDGPPTPAPGRGGRVDGRPGAVAGAFLLRLGIARPGGPQRGSCSWSGPACSRAWSDTGARSGSGPP